jgi:dienelactone hydrolase
MVKRVLFLSLVALLIGSCNSGASNSPASSVANKLEKALDTGPAGQTVSITSPDGVVLVGTYYQAENSRAPGILLLHQWQSDRHSWDEFAKDLQGDGFAVLAIDGRGFGESTKRADGSTVAAGRSDEDVKAMLGDVDAAFNYLSKQNNVDPYRVGIVGASYGSSLALIYAADHPSVAAVALLSPGLNYFGNMPTEPAMKKYGSRASILIAADDDKESADAVIKLAGPNAAKKIFANGGHGTALLSIGAAKEIETFLTGSSLNNN